jgi:DNA polymerase-3 subunit chi
LAVTEVEFHTGVTDTVAFACRLLRKAFRQGVHVLVTAPAEVLARLDRELWTAEERDFLPHMRMPGAAAATAARTPIWLATHAGVAGAPAVVVNLGADAPADPALVSRLIEVVSDEPDDAQRGRERWRAYKAAGLAIRHHGAGAARE